MLGMLIQGALRRGNTWVAFTPEGLKMSGVVVSNKNLKGFAVEHHPDGRQVKRKVKGLTPR